jgi:DNA-directed RNA polymerase specialized sigma24 family protein
MIHADERRRAQDQEQALMIAARAGDERAFACLLGGHRRGLELYCHLMLGDADAAKQAIAETVCTAWRDRQNLDAQTKVRMWLYRIAAHVCIDAIDKSEDPCDEFRPRFPLDGVKSDERAEHQRDHREG